MIANEQRERMMGMCGLAYSLEVMPGRSERGLVRRGGGEVRG